VMILALGVLGHPAHGVDAGEKSMHEHREAGV
jgi:hypothetical protein